MNPFGITKKLLGEKHSGQLSCPEEDINRHLRNTYGMREQDLGHCEALIRPPEPCTLFNTSEPTLKVRRSSNLPEQHQHQAQVEFFTRSSNIVPACWRDCGRSLRRTRGTLSSSRQFPSLVLSVRPSSRSFPIVSWDFS